MLNIHVLPQHHIILSSHLFSSLQPYNHIHGRTSTYPEYFFQRKYYLSALQGEWLKFFRENTLKERTNSDKLLSDTPNLVNNFQNSINSFCICANWLLHHTCIDLICTPDVYINCLLRNSICILRLLPTLQGKPHIKKTLVAGQLKPLPFSIRLVAPWTFLFNGLKWLWNKQIER